MGNSSQCNTLDRYNWQAHSECGIKKGTTLNESMAIKMKVDFWPYVQGPEVSQCIEWVMPHSYTNIIKIKAGQVLRVGVLTFALFGGLFFQNIYQNLNIAVFKKETELV